MNLPSPRSCRKARIEIIPLIDIIFFLLATFVMVSLSMIQNQGIKVNLPVASSGEVQERDDAVTLTIAADGTYYWNKELITYQQLSEQLVILKKKNPDPRIMMNADSKVDFGSMVAILNEIRCQGINKIAIETTTSQR